MSKRVTITFLVAFALAAVHPALVYLSAGADAFRLSLLDLGFSVFLTTFFPVSVACFANAARSAAFLRLRARERGFWCFGLLALWMAVAWTTCGDAYSRSIPPYFFKGPKAEIEAEVGREIEVRQKIYMAPAEERAGARSKLSGEISKLKRSTDYSSSPKDYFAAVSLVAYYSLFINFVGFAYAAVFFLYVIFLAQGKDTAIRSSSQRINALVLAFGALLFWFPLRLFSEWHNGFYSFDGLFKFHVALPIFAAVLVVLPLLVLITRPQNLERFLKITTTLVPGLASVLLWWQEEYLFAATRFLSQAHLFIWVFSLAIVFTGLWALAKAIGKLG